MIRKNAFDCGKILRWYAKNKVSAKSTGTGIQVTRTVTICRGSIIKARRPFPSPFPLKTLAAVVAIALVFSRHSLLHHKQNENPIRPEA